MTLTARQLHELAACLRGFASGIDDVANTLEADVAVDRLTFPDWSTTARLAAIGIEHGRVST